MEVNEGLYFAHDSNDTDIMQLDIQEDAQESESSQGTDPEIDVPFEEGFEMSASDSTESTSNADTGMDAEREVHHPHARQDYFVNPSTIDEELLETTFYEGAAVIDGYQESYFGFLKRQREEKGEQLFSPFLSEAEWRLARWMNRQGLSQAAINEYCKESLVSKKQFG